MPKDKEGFPEHGEEYHDDDQENKEGEGNESEGENEGENNQEEDPKVTIARLQGELTTLRAERTQRPATPAAAKKNEPVKRDWEKLIFEDTENAIALLRSDIRAEITGELRSEYQRDMSDKEFWNNFYRDNDDLKDDDDLVKATLGKNMGQLADLPVSKASKKLADLTRERILRYKGGEVEKKNGKKAITEGSGSPGEKKPVKEEPKILSLGDVIRARRAARAKGKAVTA